MAAVSPPAPENTTGAAIACCAVANNKPLKNKPRITLTPSVESYRAGTWPRRTLRGILAATLQCRRFVLLTM
jgi:hypothetical protein